MNLPNARQALLLSDADPRERGVPASILRVLHPDQANTLALLLEVSPANHFEIHRSRRMTAA